MKESGNRVTGGDEMGKRSLWRLGALTVIAVVAVVVLASVASSAPRTATVDPVLKTVKYVSVKGPWLVWDKKACRWKPTSKHPSTYVAQVRKQSTPLSMVFTPEATTFSVDALINGSVKVYAQKAGLTYRQLSNDYPSTSRPLQVAQQAGVIHADVAVSGNVLANLYPQIQATYEKECIAMVNMFNLPGPPDPAPGFQIAYKTQGEAMADATIKIIKQRKWPAAQTWIVLCGNIVIGRGRNTLNGVNLAFRDKVAAAFHIPSSRISPTLNCASPEEARTVTLDWLTAHPQAKYVVGTMWADALGVPMAQAFQQKGYTTNALVATGDASDAALKLMAGGDPILQVDADKKFIDWGVYSVSMAQDAVAGRPIPRFAETPLTIVTPANVKQVLAERAGFLKKAKG
jgi:ABC-type sugar transport system substrate-binding protein